MHTASAEGMLRCGRRFCVSPPMPSAAGRVDALLYFHRDSSAIKTPGRIAVHPAKSLLKSRHLLGRETGSGSPFGTVVVAAIVGAAESLPQGAALARRAAPVCIHLPHAPRISLPVRIRPPGDTG